VFLDEVAELPLAVQAKLLRALEAKTITRIGDTRERSIDVRVVAATHKNLDAEVAAGRFRQDLLFRLCGARVVLPPLRDRRCEIPLLARSFLDAACQQAGKQPKTITPAAMEVLLRYPWPGNVRQLRYTMDYAAIAAPDDTIEPVDLPADLGGATEPPPVQTPARATATQRTFRPISDELEELERRRMTEALEAAGGVKTRAAELISMPIRTFTLKFKQYKL
jgi:DNA-binding NtrC family response regulator